MKEAVNQAPIEQCAHHLGTFLNISRDLTTTTDLKKLNRKIVTIAKDLLEVDFSTLMLLSEAGDSLVIVDTLGFPESMIGTFTLIEGEGLSTYVATRKKHAAVDDFKTETRFEVPAVVHEKGISSALSVPMMVEGEVFGILIGHTLEQRTFSAEEIGLYQHFANLAAMANKNALHIRALANSKAKFRTLFDSATDAIFICDSAGNFIEVNQVACDRFGYDREELLRMKLEEVDAAHGAAEIAEKLENACLSELSLCESVHRRKDGATFPVEVNSRFITFEEKPALLGIARDITERKEAQRSLREAQGRLNTILQSLPVGMLLIDAETHVIVEVNDTAIAKLGIPRKEVVGRVCHEHVCPAEEGRCPITDLGLSMDKSERVLLAADEKEVPILKSAVEIVLDGRKYLLESFIDITDRHKAEEALRRSHEFAKTVLDSTNDAVSIIDVKSRKILEINSRFLEGFGLKEEEAVGKACSEVFQSCPEGCDSGRAPCPITQTIRSGEYALVEKVQRRGDREVHVEVSTSPIRNEEGEISQVVHVCRDITERKRSEQEIERLAYYDTLTGLPNRLLCHDRLNQVLVRASRDGEKVGVLFLDLDQFKGVNDTLGHANGDKLLQQVAKRLRKCIRRSNTVARLGGDEFIIILSSVEHEEGVASVAQKILDVLEDPMELEGQTIFNSGSIGISLYPADGEDVDTLLKNADIAMYQAKDQGRNNYQFYSPEMNTKAMERLFLETSLRHALERDEFLLHYQPQVDVETGKMIGMEALVRWQHPDLGFFSPAKFIPFAEETGLIVPIGEWVLRTACAQNKAWQDAGLPRLRVAVNLSGFQFRQKNLVEMVETVLEETGLDPAYLELELTESAIMKSPEETKRTLLRLKALGLHLAIDDFGTGHSSLSHLRHFPLDRLKIAQSFMHEITTNADDAAIADAIIAMGRSLKLQVIAEGVEEQGQAEFLRSRKCHEMQGYYYSRPVPAEEFEGFLRGGIDADLNCLDAG